jgi:Mg2+-importing ATPase
MPERYLLLATLTIVCVTLSPSFAPVAVLFGFRPPPVILLCLVAGIVVIYILTAEIVKKVFYERARF